MNNKLTLNYRERLKSRKHIDELFKKGQRFVLPPFRVFYLVQPVTDASAPLVQFGVGVSSRFFKKAVHRNRIKRVAREAWRQQKPVLQQLATQQNKLLLVFFIYTGKELPNYQDVFIATGNILEQLERKLQ